MPPDSQPLAQAVAKIRANVERVIVGKGDVIELALVAILSGGHILIEDVPGIGKTTLARSLAQSLGCTFKRIQFTPDLTPSDILGVNYYNQRIGDFQFRPGPIMAQVVLADEINRATPRTQSALLEAMQERQVTVDGTTMSLPAPFLVMATQNPIELEGTFPLPEAQLDRFLLRLELGYPDEQQEEEMLLRFERENPLAELQQVVSSEEILELQRAVQSVRVEPVVRGYLVRVIRATRSHEDIVLGASPRASLGLYRACQVLAAIRGRDYVTPDDVKYLAPFVLSHRLVLKPQTRLRERTGREVVGEVLATVPVPV